MPVRVPVRGYYLVRNSRGQGVVRLDQTGEYRGFDRGYFLGTREVDIERHFNRAVNAIGAYSLFETISPKEAAEKAVDSGAAFFTASDAGVKEDGVATMAFAAVLAMGGLVAAPFIGAGGAAGGAAAGGLGAGGAAATGGGILRRLARGVGRGASRAAGTTAGKAVAGVGVASLFMNENMWKGVGLVIAGAILIILALMQFTNTSLPLPVKV